MPPSEVRPIPSAAPDFPLEHARTQGFSLGVPRHLTVTADRVLFLRGSGQHPKQSLWVLDGDGERMLADADIVMPPGGDIDIPAEERARRERAR
ncbi:MAG TPA: hypothetical protein VMM13_19055, partial [Euzebya sp.]|nr:hypothetical protein [Euzebya sp.]